MRNIARIGKVAEALRGEAELESDVISMAVCIQASWNDLEGHGVSISDLERHQDELQGNSLAWLKFVLEDAHALA